MSWRDLPPELLAKVLTHFSLPRLRLLKTLSHATASVCRRVLLSEEWSKGTNYYQMEEEIKTQYHSYKLPLVVSIFFDDFEYDDWLLATIYKLKLKKINSEGNFLDASDASHWTDDNMCNDINDTIVSDMCIEVHGQGIAGSVWTLRRMIQEHMREHGCNDFVRNTKVNQICTAVEGNKVVEYFSASSSYTNSKLITVKEMLVNMSPVTKITTGEWKLHEAPYSGECGSDHCLMNVFSMCSAGLDLFV